MSEVTEYAPGTPCWIDLATTDPEAATAFYTGLFGWTGEDLGAEAGHYVILRKEGKDVAALYRPDSLQGPPQWNTYIAVAGLDDATARVDPAGGCVAIPPFDVMGLGRMAVVKDPMGAFVALWEPGGHIGSRLVNEPGALCWNELITSDRDRAAAFYGMLFGWSSRTDQLGPLSYTEFKNGAHSVAGMMEMLAVPPHWGVYLAVDDTDAAIARASELGGSVMRPPMDLPVGRMATLCDPQGGTFSVVAAPGD